MAGVATQKFPNNAINLGFPVAFNKAMANTATHYYPEARSLPHLYVGHDQAQALREERKRDADYMANAKVASTKKSTMRYLTTAHGAGFQPKAVLGQRQFGNPAFGYLSGSSAQKDDPNAPFYTLTLGEGGSNGHLSGGVLRSAQGQEYGKSRLMARVAELDAIDNNKTVFLGEKAGMPSTGAVNTASLPTGTEGPISPLIELNFLLQGINDAVVSGIAPDQRVEDEDEGMALEYKKGESAVRAIEGIGALNKGTFEQARRVMALLFRLAPSMDTAQMTDTLSTMNSIIQNLDGMLDPAQQERYAGKVNGVNLQSALSLQVLFTRMIAYVEEMIKGVNLMPMERLALSKALVKQLKFEKGLKYGTVPDGDLNLVADARQNALKTAQDEALFTPTGRFRRDDPYEEDAFYRRSVSAPSEGSSASNTDSFGSFQQAPPRGEGHYRGHTREDNQHIGYGRGGNAVIAFDPEARQTFGYNAGDFYPSGGRDAQWFGEMRGNTVIPGGEQLPQTKLVNTSGSGRRKGRAEAELTMASHFDPDLGGWGIKM